jgi:DNA-binding XRE family transcriptional regulator
MAVRRPGLPGEVLSSSCSVFERGARHEQSIGTSATTTRALLAQCLKRARIAAGLTQEEAALDLGGLDPRTIRRWERGTHRLDQEVLHNGPKMGPAWRVQHDLMFGPTRNYRIRRAA